jgi:hypothetical protein
MRIELSLAIFAITCFMPGARGYAQEPELSAPKKSGGALLARNGTLVSEPGRRAGRVRVDGHSLADDNGPFLGLGASYFTQTVSA